MARLLDLQSTDHDFDPQPFYYYVTILGRLWTDTCLCRLAVKMTKCPRMFYGWEGNCSLTESESAVGFTRIVTCRMTSVNTRLSADISIGLSVHGIFLTVKLAIME